MDGPHVNKSFANKFKAALNAIATLFIDIGTCPLHTANNAFSDGLKCLKDSIDLDEIAIDFHFYFSSILPLEGGTTKTFPPLHKLHCILY